MSTLMEMAEAYEAARTAPDPADKASAHQLLSEMHGVASVRSLIQGQGADECEDCGLDIPKPRRLAAPWAVCCLDCQSLREGRV